MMQEWKLCICSSPVRAQRHFYLSWGIIIPSRTSLRASHWEFPGSIWPCVQQGCTNQAGGNTLPGGMLGPSCILIMEKRARYSERWWQTALMISLMEACLGEWSVFQYSGNNELPSVGSAIFKKPFSFCSTVISQATPILSNTAQGKKRIAGNAWQSSLSLWTMKQTVPSST